MSCLKIQLNPTFYVGFMHLDQKLREVREKVHTTIYMYPIFRKINCLILIKICHLSYFRIGLNFKTVSQEKQCHGLPYSVFTFQLELWNELITTGRLVFWIENLVMADTIYLQIY